MLSSVLRSERAVKANIAIMRAFAGLSEPLLPSGHEDSRLVTVEVDIAAHEIELSEHAAQLNEIFAGMRRGRGF